MFTAFSFMSAFIKLSYATRQGLSSFKRPGLLNFIDRVEREGNRKLQPPFFTKLAQRAHNSKEIQSVIEEAEKRYGKQLPYQLLSSAAHRAKQLDDVKLAVAFFRRVPKVDIHLVLGMMLPVLEITDGKKLIEDIITSPVPKSLRIADLGSFLKFCERCGDVELGKRVWSWGKVVRELNPNEVGPTITYLMLCGKTGDMDIINRTWNEAVTAGCNSRPEVLGAMITVLAAHGDVNRVDHLLSQVSHDQIDKRMLSSALTAYSHNKLAKEAWDLLKKMEAVGGSAVVGIYAYTAVVDAFARKGDFQSAFDVIEKAKEKGLIPDSVMWKTILGPCRSYKELPIALLAFEEIKKLDPTDSAAYVLMADVYRACGNFVAAVALHEERLSRGLVKKPGAVTTTVHGKTYTFHVDEIPAELVEAAPSIQAKLDEWNAWLASQGVSTESIECRHSEKLALAYAVCQKVTNVTLRKNLRVCAACHKASVHITTLEGITIHHWDRSRLHIMKDGKCSCGDYY